MSKIQLKAKAPEFTAIDYLGNEVVLSAYKGKKVYLTFFRTASCPFCNLRVNQLMKKAEEWSKKNVVIIGVFASPTEEIKKYAGKQNPTFTIIADSEEILYKEYQIKQSFFGMFKAMMRMKTMMTIMTQGYFNFKTMTDKPLLTADFLINKEGMIEKVYYGRDFGDHLSIEEIEGWI